MAKLKMTDSSGREQEYEIGPVAKVFGRAEDSDVILGSRSIARHHMKVWADAEKILVEDLTEGKGIYRDGKEVSGTIHLEPGDRLEVGGFVFWVPGQKLAPAEPAVPKVEEAASWEPLLEGTRGPTKPIEIVLKEGDNDIGRDPSLYIVIDDSSVSRHHARLNVQKNRFQILDMHSSNGTFVNSRRIDAAELVSGDFVRIGNLEFRFLYGPPVSKAALAIRRKRMILLTAGSLLGMALILAFPFFRKDPPVQKPPPKVKPLSIDLQAEQHLVKASNLMENMEWDLAEAELDSALDLYPPLSPEVYRLKKAIKDERANGELFREATVDYEINKWSESLAMFGKIPRGSAYYRKAKFKISELEEKLTEKYLTEGKSYFKARQYDNAHKQFVAYLQIKPCDREVYEKWVKVCEEKMRRHRERFSSYSFNCVESSGNAQQGISSQPVGSVGLLKARYPEKELFEAILLYMKGKAELAIQALRRTKALSAQTELVARADELERSLMVVDGKYREGVSSLLKGDLMGAEEKFRLALEHDAKIIPGTLRSFYREDIGAKLSDKLARKGQEEFAHKLWKRAFELWTRCIQVNPNGTDCLEGLKLLETEAERQLENADNLDQQHNPKAVEVWKEVQEFTRPESLPYKKAQLKLRDRQ